MAEQALTSPAPNFWSSLGQLGSVTVASLTVMRLMTADLPPWAAELTKNWGPVVLVILLLVGLLFRFVPKDAVQQRFNAQQAQAASNAIIAASLQNISGAGGRLDKIEDQVVIVVNNQG